MQNFTPLRGLVLIDREMPAEILGGIYIPEDCRQYGWRAKVVSVGENVTNVKTGDQILFLKEFTRLPFTEERNMALTNAENIAATIIVEDDTERIIPANNYVMIEPEHETSEEGEIIPVKKFDDVESKWGVITKCGSDCEEIDTFIGHRCCYPSAKVINCIEDDKRCVLVEEGDILCAES